MEELLALLAVDGEAVGEVLEAVRLGGEAAAGIVEAEPEEDDAVLVRPDLEDVLPRGRIDEDGGRAGAP